MKVAFTPTGRLQLIGAVRYIAADNKTGARRFASEAKRKLRRLNKFPNSGRRIPEFPDLPHREVIVNPYRFFYRIDGKIVWIVAVWHGAQLPTSPDEAA